LSRPAKSAAAGLVFVCEIVSDQLSTSCRLNSTGILFVPQGDLLRGVLKTGVRWRDLPAETGQFWVNVNMDVDVRQRTSDRQAGQ
jgi:hypothetical protein